MDKDPRYIAVEHEELKSKYLLMQHEWRCQQEVIGRLEIQMTKIRSQLKYQAQFCSKAGSIFGNLLWQATQIPDVINIVLQQNRILELSQIMISVLMTFNDTYQTKVPISDTDETRFVLSIIGLIANLTTENEGRRFFSQIIHGKRVIQLIMCILTRVPSPSGNQLKKIAYAALYNVSIYSIPAPQLINCELITLLNDEIKDNNTNVDPDLRLFALKLIHSLIRNICSKAAFNIIYYNINRSQLLKLTSAFDAETELITKSILSDLDNAKKRFDLKIIMS